MAAVAERSVAERLEQWSALNQQIGHLEAAGVRYRHPDYSEHEVFLAIVRRRYGDHLFRAAWPDEALVDP